jgi:sugar phosphate isomerase/epimerase
MTSELTRKEFLQTVAGAAVSASIAGSATAVSAPKSKIKLGASLYSYNGDFLMRTMNLEDCIADIADMGSDGIEIIAQGQIEDFPNPSEKWVKQWFGWMDKYGVQPTCYDTSGDTKLYLHRELTAQEMVDQMTVDLQLAKRLGFKRIRTYGNSWATAIGAAKGNGWNMAAPPPLSWPWGKAGTSHFDIIRKCLPIAEKLDIKIVEELHIPMLLKSEYMERTVEFIQKTKTKHYGFKPDFSIFLRQEFLAGSPAAVQALVEKGARQNVIEFIVNSYESGAPAEKTQAEVAKMGGNDVELRYASASGVYHGSYSRKKFNAAADLIPFMPYVYDTHAKFRVVTEQLRETTMPYEEIIPVLAQNGYDGYLSSEYEGARDVFLASQQLRRQHCMMRQLWDKA